MRVYITENKTLPIFPSWTSSLRWRADSLVVPDPESVEPPGQAALVASERFEERGEPQMGREAFEKLDVPDRFAQQVRAGTVSRVTAVGKASRIDDVDCSDLVGSVVAHASAVEVDGHAWAERSLVTLENDTA